MFYLLTAMRHLDLLFSMCQSYVSDSSSISIRMNLKKHVDDLDSELVDFYQIFNLCTQTHVLFGPKLSHILGELENINKS